MEKIYLTFQIKLYLKQAGKDGEFVSSYASPVPGEEY
jgi:hypothetical protein